MSELRWVVWVFILFLKVKKKKIRVMNREENEDVVGEGRAVFKWIPGELTKSFWASGSLRISAKCPKFLFFLEI